MRVSAGNEWALLQAGTSQVLRQNLSLLKEEQYDRLTRLYELERPKYRAILSRRVLAERIHR